MDLLINQARKYMPEVVVIANEQKYPELKEALEDLPIKVWAGSDAIARSSSRNRSICADGKCGDAG